ncbi:MAG: response receiver histidine kinase [Cyanobacteria bacterium RYN_339]|nr:response receiver histidine kinase [Cyanobacteria bacterium RYN_339]
MSAELDVLVVEDDPGDVILLLRLLKAGGFTANHRVVADLAGLRDALAQWRWHLVVSDYELPGFGGMEALAATRALAPDTPFILFSGTIGEEAAVAAMKAGAADYVHKDRPARLAPAIARELREAEARRARVAAERAFVEERERHVKELEAANRYLLEADRHKDEFVSVVSHELRTPLTVVMGYADLLGRGVVGDLTPAQADVTGHIGRGARKLLDLVMDLLEYAQLQAGRVEFQFAPTDLVALKAEVEQQFRVAAEAKAIILALEVSGRPNPRMDGQRLRGILRHLVGNALKFTPQGGRVDVRLAATADELAVEVRDTGVGIAPELQARLFEGFRQADMSNTRQAGGLGLGLGIARGMVAALGGTIGVESSPGEGSRFWCRLPVAGTRTAGPAVEEPECSRNSLLS